MAIIQITELPPAPLITDTESQFANKASTFVSALDGFVTDANNLATQVNDAVEEGLVIFSAYKGEWSSGETYATGNLVFHAPSEAFYISDVDNNTSEPPSSDWRIAEVGGAGATGGGGDEVFVQNDQVVTTDYTIPADKNAMTAGPIDIQAGVTVTVSTGARWVVI